MVPGLGGLSKRSRALILLTVQNASIALLTRASRVGSADDLYLPSVAVLGAEVGEHPGSISQYMRPSC